VLQASVQLLLRLRKAPTSGAAGNVHRNAALFRSGNRFYQCL